MSIRKLSMLDASDILKTFSIDEVPEGYRDEVYAEEENGEVVDNWFVGSNGAVSYSGTTIPNETFNKKVEVMNAVDGSIVDVSDVFITCEKCGMEIEEEAIAKDGKPYHYRCSDIEL